MIDRRLAFRLTERTERVTSARGLTWSGHAEPGRVDRGSQQEEGGDLGGTADAGAAPTVAAAHQVRTLRSPSGVVGVVGPPLSGGGAPRYAHPGSAAGSPSARPPGAHTARSTAWRSAPTASASSPAARTRRCRLWDADTGQPIGQPLNGHTSGVHERGVQPRRQTHRLRQRGQDGEGVGRATPARKSALRSRGTQSAVYSVAFSPDGKRIVSGSWDKTVKVWDAATGQERSAHPQRAHGLGRQRGVQPRRQDASSPAATTRRCRCGTRTRASRSASRSRGTRTGVRAWRSAPTARRIVSGSDDTDGEGVGRRHGPADRLALKGHTDAVSAWRSAPTASASSPAVGTRR